MNQELLVLILLHLKDSPLQKTFQSLVQELADFPDALPERINVLGELVPSSLGEVYAKYAHVQPNRLAQLVVGPLLASSTRQQPLEYADSMLVQLVSRSLSPTSMRVMPSFLVHRFAKLFSTRGHLSQVNSVNIDSSSRYVVTAGSDGLVKIWSHSGHLIRTIRAFVANNANVAIVDIAFTQNNEFLVVSCSDKTIRIWNFYTGKFVSLLRVSHRISQVSVFGSGCILVACDDSRPLLYTLDPVSCQFNTDPIQLNCGTLAKYHVVTLVANQTGSLFVTGGEDGILCLFSLQEGNPVLLCQFSNHRGRINIVRFSWGLSSGYQFLSACRDGTACIYRFNMSTYKWDTLTCIFELE